MPARLVHAHHALRATAACQPSKLATRSLSIAAAATSIRTQSQTQSRANLRLQVPAYHQLRPSSSSSSARWKTRQTSDPYTKSSKLTALKSRAAYKLLEINEKHKIFKPGQSVVDLGYAPGSWSQVAKNRVGETGRVVGIDLIPAQPPRGVSALQGDFLSEGVQGLVREYVREWKLGAARENVDGVEEGEEGDEEVRSVVDKARGNAVSGVAGEEAASQEDEGYVSAESIEEEEIAAASPAAAVPGNGKKATPKKAKRLSAAALDLQKGRVVDVVLSDMMMNTSGNPFRDHAGSIDLCMAALTFCHDCLMTGGHFLCKFYQGPEDKDLENRMKKLFEKVHRIKPDSSRKESRESYFVGLRRKADVSKEDVFG